MKFSTVSVVITAVVAATTANAFVVVPQAAPFRRAGVRLMATGDGTDVSIEYDAAAKLAYLEWRSKFGKGGYDEAKFQAFKEKYLEVTSANMGALKKARDAGTEAGPMQELGADADAIYEDASAPVATDGGLSDGMKARLMSEASTGLDPDAKQTNVILYISIAVALLVAIGGKGILY